MKILFAILLLGQVTFAQVEIDVTIDWVENAAKSTILEVCGKATAKDGKWPLIVSITHQRSTFSTVTDKDGKYCQLLARQTFKGEVTVNALSMDGQSLSSPLTVSLKNFEGRK